MNKQDLIRLVVLGFFIGLNIILGTYFLVTVVGANGLPKDFNNYLQQFSRMTGIELEPRINLSPTSPKKDEVQIDLDATSVIDSVNQIRTDSGLNPLKESTALSMAATDISSYLEANNFDQQSDAEMDDQLKNALEKQSYAYMTVLQSAVAGPVNLQDLQQHWQTNQVNDLFETTDISEMGVSTKVVEHEGEFSGITVILLASPAVGQATTINTNQGETAPSSVPFISDDEVFTALNQYRADHGVHQLVINQQLCRYAEKRVQDLIAFGGLDNHQGFKDDFADLDNLPAEIKDYRGGRIGENLAHQFCKNMTTGDSFIAQTGTSLIEWCFDSSTKGHREAQLDTAYNNVCVKHGNSMYVVIFGE